MSEPVPRDALPQPQEIVSPAATAPSHGDEPTIEWPNSAATPARTPDASSSNHEAITERPTLPPQNRTSVPEQPTLVGPPDGLVGSVSTVGDTVVMRRFGDYDLVDEIARGGMGVVFKARQVRLNRIVAVKMILTGQLASQADVQRFYAEAEAAANLQHPNIVGIHEVGELDGQHFFSMDYVAGSSLTDLVRDGPLDSRRAAAYVQTTSEAIHYAHQHGILHRDLKPSNVLLDEHDQPRVTDFGLAKRIEGGSQLTATGTMVGTPSYMPPEQASPHAAVGPTSDVYSLGAILYELVTARPPFQAATPLDTLLMVLDAEPTAPHLLNRKVDRDVETIALKCLQKDPLRRYASAQDLADDLGRYLRGEPIEARPVGRAERSWRWCRRNPTVASLLGTVAALLLMAAVAGGLVAHHERGLRTTADQARQQAERSDAQTRNRLVRRSVAAGVRLLEEHDPLGSLPWFAEALSLEPPGAAQEMHRDRLSAVLWQAPKPAQVWFHDGKVNAASFNFDGSRVVTACADGTARVWDVSGGQGVTPMLRHSGPVLAAAFSPDGQRVVTASDDGTARIWNAETGEQLVAPLEHSGPVVHCEFSFDGRLLATASADKTARIWDAESGVPTVDPLGHDYPVSRARFSPDGRLLVTASGEHIRGRFGRGNAQIWDVACGKLAVAPLEHEGGLMSATFSPDGKRLVTTTDDFVAKVWDSATGRLLFAPLKHINIVNCAAFSPDGSRLITGCDDNTARVFDAATGEILTPPLKHAGEVKQLSFSPDGRRVATASFAGSAEVWDVLRGELAVARLQHGGPVDSVQFSPNGRRIITTCRDGTARVWDLTAGEPVPREFAHAAQVNEAAYSPDGRQVATASEDGTARIWDVVTGQPITPPLVHRARVTRVAFSPDGAQVATASHDHTARVWNAASGEPNATALEHGDAVLCAAFSPDGTRVVTGSVDQTARVWQVQDGQTLTPPLQHAGWVQNVVFSPDGKWVATVSQDATARVWDAATGEPVTPSMQHPLPVLHAMFSHDGLRLVTSSGKALLEGGGEARVWDSRTGQSLVGPFKHSHGVAQAWFSPSDLRIVTASFDDTARVWDALSGEPVTPSLRHTANVNTARFSTDARRVVTASDDRTARVWDAATGEPLTPPLVHSTWCRLALFSHDGRQVLTLSMDNVACVWDLPLDHRPAKQWTALAELLAGRRLYGDSDFVVLEPEKFRTAWQSLSAEQIRGFASTADQAVAWHRREAFDCRIAGQWFASAWHLGRLIELDPASAPQAYVRRARSYAELGEWSLATADYRQAEELGVHDPERAYHQALLSLATDDAASYRRLCAELVEAAQSTADPNQINTAAWTCVLAPDAAADLSPLVRSMEQLLAHSPGNPAVLNTLGAICLRAGDSESAARHLQAAIHGNNNVGTPWDWLLLALAEQKRGHKPELRQWLEKAAVWIDRETNPRTRGTSGERLGWEQRLELRLLRSEAEAAEGQPTDEK